MKAPLKTAAAVLRHNIPNGSDMSGARLQIKMLFITMGTEKLNRLRRAVASLQRERRKPTIAID